MKNDLQHTIDAAWMHRSTLHPAQCEPSLLEAITQVLMLLNQGCVRVAEKKEQEWCVNGWVSRAVSLAFRVLPCQFFSHPFAPAWDRMELKYQHYSLSRFQEDQVRVVPGALVRHGCYVAPGVVLMPCYINVGSYIDGGTMIDMGASIGSCAQIGRNVHISAQASIGGVLEPVNATPVIIEENVFVGSHVSIVEGVRVERDAVIAAGVTVTASTKIYDRCTDTISYGRIPAGAVVVPGVFHRPAYASCSTSCAVIVKTVDHATRQKLSINELLRDDGAQEGQGYVSS